MHTCPPLAPRFDIGPQAPEDEACSGNLLVPPGSALVDIDQYWSIFVFFVNIF